MSTILPDYSYFIIDDYFNIESAPDNEIPVYFYPPNHDFVKVALLLGQIKFLINFTATFVRDEIKIMTSSNKKYAIKRLNNFTMVLSGLVTDENNALMNLLKEICDTYYFHNGDINATLIGCKNGTRSSFLRLIKYKCESILPILKNITNNGTTFLNLVPQTTLTVNNSRCLIQASNILRTLSNQNNVYNGCIFYDDTVLCSYLDADITQRILTQCIQLRSTVKDKLKQMCKINGHLSVEKIKPIFMPIYLNKTQEQSLSETEIKKQLILCVIINFRATLAFIMTTLTMSEEDLCFSETIVSKFGSKLNQLEAYLCSVANVIQAPRVTEYDFLNIKSTKLVPQCTLIEINNNKSFIKHINFMDELLNFTELDNKKSSKVILSGHLKLSYAYQDFDTRKYYQSTIGNIGQNIQNLEQQINNYK
jgi:hypothetical protein